MPGDEENGPVPLYDVSFAIPGQDRQSAAWSILEALGRDHGVRLDYNRGLPEVMTIVVRGKDRTAIDRWSAAAAGRLGCATPTVDFLPVLRWRVLVRLPDDQRERYRDYIGDSYPTAAMDQLCEVEDPDVPTDLEVWYFRTADHGMLAGLFENTCDEFSGEVVAIEEFPETAEERDAGDKVALHAQLIGQWIPAGEQGLAHLLVALIQDHLDGQDWQSMSEELAEKAGLLVLGFPDLLGDIDQMEDPGAAIAKQLIARCRAIVEQPSGPWREVLARLPRAPA